MDIPAVRDFKVANIQDASVTIMDYYEPSKCQSFQMDLSDSEAKNIMFLFMEMGQILVNRKPHCTAIYVFH